MSQFTIYELNDIYMNFQELVLSGAASEEDITIAMINLQDELESKADSYATMDKNFEAAEGAILKEIERLTKKARVIKNTRKKMKLDLELIMKMMDVRKFKTDRFSFRIQRNAPKLEITSENEIPEEYIIIEKRADKTKIKQAMKEGIEVPGVALKESESLRIRWCLDCWKLKK